MPDPDCPYVSRGGLKLAAALDHFRVDPTDLRCADLGCSVGGFVDCLIQRHAAHVYAVDTAYGELAWPLRQHPRVTVLERSNALHVDPPERVDLVTIDLGWTKQDRAIPAALRWLKDDPAARIITLIKPQYEQPRSTKGQKHRKGKPLDPDIAQATLEQALDAMPALGVGVLDHLTSPIPGGKGGNIEYLALLRRT